MNDFIRKSEAQQRILNSFARPIIGQTPESIRTNEILDVISKVPTADVVENSKRTTFEPDAARDLKNFVEACEIDDGIMGAFEADRIRTYLYALIDEAKICKYGDADGDKASPSDDSIELPQRTDVAVKTSTTYTIELDGDAHEAR